MTVLAWRCMTIALLTLAACSGGGGGSSSTPATSGGGGTGGASSQSTQRSVAGTALSVVGGMVNANQLGLPGNVAAPAQGMIGGALTAAAAAVPPVAGSTLAHGPLQPAPVPLGPPVPLATPAASGTCKNGVIFSSTTANGVTTESIEFFFDAVCTQPHRLETLVITPPSSSSSTGTADGSVEVWDQSGNVIAYQTVALSYTGTANGISEVSQLLTEASSPTSVPFAQQGNTCVFGTVNAIDCGQANAVDVASLNESLGFTETTLGQSISPAVGFPGGATWLGGSFAAQQITINGAGYTGATGGLTLQAASAPPAWNVIGGTQVVTLTGTVSIGFGFGDAVSAVNLTLTDAADGLTMTLTSASNGKLTGNVTNTSGQTVATIALDRSGTGQITYTNGTTGQVKDWIILS